jgi:hypothetical protein
MFVIPKIDKSQALIELSKKPRPLTRKRKIIKVELLYVPCYIFTVQIVTNKGNQSSEQVCIDGVQGLFAFFKGAEFEKSAHSSARTYDFKISQSKAESFALEQYKRQLLKHSLKKKVQATVDSIQFDKKIYYPYWIGYFRRKRALDFDVIDGISGVKQGAKMKPLFMTLLLQ